MQRNETVTKESFIAWALRHGYTQDKYGHLTKTTSNGLTRMKIQDKSVRMERRVEIVGKNEWLRLRTGFFGTLSITAEDKITGFRR